MATKKEVKNVKRLKKLLKLIIFLGSLIIFVTYILNVHVKNIYIINNNILSDKEIIELAELNNYPLYINSYFINIKNKLLKNDYIKNVNIKRKLLSKIYLEIEEYKPLAIYQDNLILSSKKKINNTYQIGYVPYIINNIDSIYDNFVDKFILVNDDILLKISQIEYVPNDVDNERFLLYMVDANYVYITLSKIEKINKYNYIVNELEGKMGIIYLDSGDYVEIKSLSTLDDDNLVKFNE